MNVHLPNSLTTIGNYVFYGCHKLENINIPDNVTWLGNGAFAGCVRLKNVEISDSTFQRLCPQMEKDNSWRYGAFTDFSHSAFSLYWCWPVFSDIRITFPFKQKSELNATPIWFQRVAMEKYYEIEKLNRENWKQHNRCQHCGYFFDSSGIFIKHYKCALCGVEKDYDEVY